MPLLQYLQLQPVDPHDDGTTSDLDDFPQDELIDLTQDEDGDTLSHAWEEIEKTFHSVNDESE